MIDIRNIEMEGDETMLIFLKFAIQCSGSPLNRPLISPEMEANAAELVSHNKLPEKGFERKYRLAYAGCSITAHEMGKKKIDKEVVLEYFLHRHNINLDADLAMGFTFRDEIDCKTYPGVITKLNNKFAVVETPAGEMHCSRIFASGLETGALVAVHRNVIAMQISRETAEKMETALKQDNRKKLKSVG